MHSYSTDDISKLDHIFKINLINSCTGFKSANLIGSRDLDGNENVAVFSSITHIGSNPPLIGFFLRPTTVTRNTYENIKQTGLYTINHIYKEIIEDAHHTSAKYDKHTSEFDVTNLEAEYKENINVPFVKTSPVQILVSYQEEYPIKANNTILVIGKIEHLYVNQDIVEKDGFINLSKANIATINGLGGYALPKLEKKLSYQRPKFT